MDFANNGGSGFTVTPSVSYNEAGEEIVSYEDAFVENQDYRQQIIQDFNNDNTQFISEDYQGNASHAYELDEEQSMRMSEDWAEEPNYEDFAAPISPEDEEMIFDQVGGVEEYSAMMDWAAENCHPDDVEWFNAVVEQGNVEDILQAVENLYGVYVDAYDGDEPEEVSDLEDEYEFLASQEPEGMELAMEQLQDAYDLQESDPAASVVMQASSMFHRGDMTAEDAIAWVIDTVGEEEAIRAYQQFI